MISIYEDLFQSENKPLSVMQIHVNAQGVVHFLATISGATSGWTSWINHFFTILKGRFLNI